MHFFFEGDDYFLRLREAFLGAKTSIDIEIYYIASDELGWEIARLLGAKAQEGVRVRLIFDSIGCRNTSIALFKDLKRNGILLKEFNPYFPFLTRWGPRDHRKLCLVDGSVGFIGGYNIAKDYSRRYSGHLGWRDSGLETDDPAILSELLRLFQNCWEGKRMRFRDYIRWRRESARLPPPPVRVTPGYGWPRKSLIRDEYLSAIIHAQKYIFITNPYFVPDLGILRALRRAAARGVDVRILTAGEKTDVRIARWAGQATYHYLMARGVRMYEYQDRMMHAKSALVDGSWFTIGTANLDHLSLFRNIEVNISGQNAETAATLHVQFQKDLEGAREIRLEEWKKRSWFAKNLERVLYFFRIWL